MTSLATAVGGMKHWDWCPICRNGLDTGLECDQCGADMMPIYKAFKDLQARPTDSAVLRAIKARADRSRLGYGGKAWVTSDPKSEVVEDRMILIEIVSRQEFAIKRLCAALNEAADSFKNAGLSVDAEDCEQAIEESLSGGNPGEPTACHTAEERGIAVATGAGQLPDDDAESTHDSAERRSPGGIPDAPSPDESNRQSFGWVIEGAWSSVATPDYWVGASTWSPDHMTALRFARSQDAQQAADLMLSGVNVRVCYHIWEIKP